MYNEKKHAWFSGFSNIYHEYISRWCKSDLWKIPSFSGHSTSKPVHFDDAFDAFNKNDTAQF